MRRLGGMFALVVSFVASTAQAKPRTYRDDATKFAVTLPLSSTQIACIHEPPGERLPGCSSILGKPPQIRSADRVVLFATILEGNWNSQVLVSAHRAKDVGEIGAEGIEDVGKQLASSVEALGAPLLPGPRGEKWTAKAVKIHGLDAIRFIANRGVPNDTPNGHIVMYTLMHQDYLHELVFMSPLAHADDLDRFADATIETIEAEPSNLRLFGEPRLLRGLHRAWVDLWPYALGCIVISAALLTWERRRRAKAGLVGGSGT